jgi:hypothetical protein
MIVKGKEYFWQSGKDGAFYLLKLNSINKNGNFNMRICERIHDGWLTTKFTQKLNVIICIDKDKTDLLYTDFSMMEIDYMFKLVNCSTTFEFEKTLYMYRDFLELLHHSPDRYIKYIDKLLENDIFNSLVAGKYKLTQ